MDLRKRVDRKVYEFHNTHCSAIIITVAYIKVDDRGGSEHARWDTRNVYNFFAENVKGSG
jgi:hypothetical protein